MKKLNAVALLIILALATSVAQTPAKITKADIDRMMTEVSNWGRWGKDDQAGALNLITAAKRKQAVALVKEGFSVSLARETNTEKAADNTDPYEHRMILTGINN